MSCSYLVSLLDPWRTPNGRTFRPLPATSDLAQMRRPDDTIGSTPAGQRRRRSWSRRSTGFGLTKVHLVGSFSDPVRDVRGSQQSDSGNRMCTRTPSWMTSGEARKLRNGFWAVDPRLCRGRFPVRAVCPDNARDLTSAPAACINFPYLTGGTVDLPWCARRSRY